MSTPLVDLAGLDRAEIETLVESLGYPRFHARQIFQWLDRMLTDRWVRPALRGERRPHRRR